MFRFFTQKNWFLWSWIGSAIILSSLWIQVKIDVKINEWFGEFYDMIQKALGAPNSITIEEYWASLLSFITLAAMYVGVAVIVSFFTSHYLFRWRTAMVEWYHSVYDKARKIEGAAQRVQEDTIKFSRIMESLGTSLIEALMILIEFMPILFGLSIGIPIFFFGDWDYGLIVGALMVRDEIVPQQIVTFGAPRCGRLKLLDGIPVTCYRHGKDIVPLVPPLMRRHKPLEQKGIKAEFDEFSKSA